MPNPIKVAVLGFWHVHAAEYAAWVRQHPETKLVAVWDDDLARGQAAAESLDTAFCDDLDDLLNADNVDAVTVTAATSQHHAIMISAANAGKHIFTEKLLAPTVAEAEATIEPTATPVVEEAEEAEPVQGLSTLMLLFGLGAVVAVGGVALTRERSGKSSG